jgi:excisionase family DNA binding protein
MAQKLTSLEDAADQLGISKDRLNALREAGKVRAYRDGASWKIRSEDVERLAAEGIPQIDPGASDLSLDVDDLKIGSSVGESSSSALNKSAEDISAAKEDSDLGLASDEELASEPASDLSLDDVDEPTVAGLDEGSDDGLALDMDDSIDINKDSILLSEAELGSSMGRPPSTIIGKAELDLDADLDLSPLDKGTGPASDVSLAPDSDLLPVGEDDLALDMPSPSANFEGLEELDVDLEAESSRILSPEDVAKAQQAAKSSAKSKGKAKATGLSDLGLAPLDSGLAAGASDVNLGSGIGSGVGLSGLSALELDDDNDDQVLGEGSDVTLSGESSGINIISPSDSGLALDEVPLDLSGSAPIGSSLDLGSGADMSLEPLALGGGASKVGEDFQLTPLGEDDGDEEKDSSQVIALDEITEETAGAPLGSVIGEGGMMSEDFVMSGGLTAGTAPAGATAAAVEMPFSTWNVLGLASCFVLLAFCGMMTFDLLRNMWSWNGVSTINSSLLEVLNPFLGR